MERSDLNRTVSACLRGLGPSRATLLQVRQTLVPKHRTVDDDAILAAFGSGDLELEETLGEGGMGIVHLATQRPLGRRVAVKTLRPEHRDAEAAAKMLREAWVTGLLEHPNILPIHDIRFDAEGLPQIVLKRIEGDVWTDVMHDEDVARDRYKADNLLDMNLEVLMQVCRAVHFAHANGIVHRDLKPDNVMIGAHGEVYLLDWGIAASLEPGGYLPWVGSEDCDIAGTPGYMAPEMIRATGISELSDVYLLGAVLYEIMSGRPPHVGATPEAIARSVLTSTPKRPDDAPDELFAIAQRAMHPIMTERYGSAEELRLAVQQFLQHRTASRLAAEAELRLELLTKLVRAPNPLAERAEAYELYGGCRFGFREALAAWPDNPEPRRGIERAVEAMVELEIACRDGDAAAELLGELTRPPPELVQRVERVRIEGEAEKRRLAALEELGSELDELPGARSRRLVIAAIGFTWTVAPLIAAAFSQEGQHVHPAYSPGIVLFSLAVFIMIGREQLSRTAVNRRVVAAIAIGAVAQLAVSLTYSLRDVSIYDIRMQAILIWGIVAAMAAIAIDRRLAIGAAGFFVAYVAATLFARDLADVLVAMALANLTITVNALYVWRPRRAPESRRFRPKQRGL